MRQRFLCAVLCAAISWTTGHGAPGVGSCDFTPLTISQSLLFCQREMLRKCSFMCACPTGQFLSERFHRAHAIFLNEPDSKPKTAVMFLSGGDLPKPTRIFFRQIHGVWFYMETEKPFHLRELDSWGCGTDGSMRRMAKRLGYKITWTEDA